MESRYEYGASQFFFPIGFVESLESDVFFLIEAAEQDYKAMMQMPYSRRKRLVDRIYTKQKTMANKSRGSMSR